MFRYIANAVMRPLIELWLQMSVNSWQRSPLPAASPTVHGAGADPVRVLLSGSGIATGYGVHTHDLGYAGQLARQLAKLSGRAIDIDIHVSPQMTAKTCSHDLSSVSLGRFDAIVLVVGTVEALQLRSSKSWRKDVGALLETTRSNSGAETEIFVVSMPMIGAATPFPVAFNALVRHQSRQFTAITSELLAGEPHSCVIALDDLETLRSTGSASAERWASITAPHMSDAVRRSRAVRRRDTVDETQRQRSLDALDILDSEPSESFDLIAAIARDLFDVSMAAITFIDHDRQWTKASVGFIGSVIPRRDAFCNITIEEPRHFAVEDTRDDSRFADGPLASRSGVKFYAGYPIESADGQRIGALCVMDDVPRRFTPADGALLRSLALRVQDLLWDGVR